MWDNRPNKIFCKLNINFHFVFAVLCYNKYENKIKNKLQNFYKKNKSPQYILRTIFKQKWYIKKDDILDYLKNRLWYWL